MFLLLAAIAAAADTPAAPAALAAYGTRSQELEVRWSSSDYAAVTGFKVQWKSGTQEYDSTRQAVADPATSVVPASSSETNRRYKYVITGLTNGIEHTVRVVATSADGDSDPSAEATGTPSAAGQPRRFIEKEVIETYEASYPWLRETWDHVTGQAVSVAFSAGGGGHVSVFCSPARPMEHGLRKCYAESISIGLDLADRISLIVHELAHVHTLANGVANKPGPLGIAHVYFRQIQCNSSRDSELYADLMMILVTGVRSGNYWKGACLGVTEAALAVTRSAVSGQLPSWFSNTYDDANGEPDLERLWADIKTTTYSAAIVFQLRNEFGGYCDNQKATASAFGTGVARNPWRDGGCVPRAPDGLIVTPVGSGKLTVSWEEPDYDGGSPVQGYKVQWKSGTEEYDSSRQAVVTDLTNLSLTTLGLVSGTQHTLRVLAYNDNGDGAGSEATATPVLTDTTVPRLTAAAVAGATLVLSYNEALQASSEPASNAFAVTVGGAARAVDAVSAAGSAVTLTLAAAVAVGAAVTVSYTVPDGPGAQPIRDAAGNAAAALSERTVRNHTTAVAITSDAGADKTYVFAGGRGTEDSIAITVTFSERVQVTGVPELTLNVGSARKTAAYHAGSGTTALEFRYPVAEGDEDSDGVSVPAGTRVRTGGAISYLADNAAAPAHPELPAQSGHLVDGVPPALITGGAVVNGVTLTLTFDEPLDEGSAPLAGGGILAFVDGTSVTPTEVTVIGRVVTLTLPSAVTADQEVTVAYAPYASGSSPIQDMAGNHLVVFPYRLAVTNSAGPPTNTPATGLPTISGTARVGQTLTASTAGIMDADGLSGVTFSYQWIARDGSRDTDITGATEESYTLRAADAGNAIMVRVTFIDDGGTTETLVSAATEAVAVIPVRVFFGGANYTATEGGPTARVMVRLSTDPMRAVTIPLTASAAGGAAAADYAVADRVSFASGETVQTVTVTASDDAVDDDGESVVVGFGTPLPEGVTADTPATAVVAIEDNDDQAVSFAAAGYSVAEGAGVAVPVELSSVPQQAVVVSLIVTPGGGANVADYTVEPLQLSFVVGTTARTVMVTAADDHVDDDGETITLSFAPLPQGVTAGSQATATVTIGDDDERGVTLSGDTVVVPEGTEASYTVVLNSRPTATVTVDVGVPPGTDVTVSPEELEFTAPAWDRARTVTVSAATDPDTAVDAAVTVTHTANGGDYVAVGAGMTVRIVESDTVAVSVAGVTASAAESAGPLVFAVSLSSESSAAVTVAYATVDGTASAGADYVAQNGTLTFQAGETRLTIAVPLIDDGEDESREETFTVMLGAAENAWVAIASATGTIEDDEALAEGPTPQVKPQVTISSTAAFPANTTFTVNIVFSENVTGLALADMQVSSGSAANLRGSGSTYTVQVTPPANFEGAVTFTVAAGTAVNAGGNGNEAASAAFLVDTRAPTVRETTMERPVDEWTSPLDTGADIAGGVVRYPDGGGGAVAHDGGTGARSDTLTLAYDEALDESSPPPPAAFEVRVDGAPRTVSTVTLHGDAVQLELASPVATGQSVTVSYTVPSGAAARPIRDLTGNVAGNLAGASVPGAAAAETAHERTERYERVNRALLPQVAAAMSASTRSAIAARDVTAPSGELSLAGVSMVTPAPMVTPVSAAATDPWQPPAAARGITLRELLNDASFVLPLAVSAAGAAQQPAGALALWGRGDYRRLAGGTGAAVDWSGALLSLHVGADLLVVPELLAGVAVTWSQGDFDYTDRTGGAALRGEYATELIGVYPYASWSSPGIGLGLWVTAGYGWGKMTLDTVDDPERSSPTRLLSGAVGGSGRLLSTDGLIAGGTTVVRVKGTGEVARIEVAEAELIAPLELDTRRVRLTVEGSHAQRLAWGGRLTPVLEVGVRYDDGDGPRGAGLELGGELGYTHPELGLTAAGHGRLLATHQEAIEDWGAGALIRLELGTGRQGVAPYGGLSLGDGARTYHLGVRMSMDALNLSVEGARSEQHTNTPPDHGLTLGGSLHY